MPLSEPHVPVEDVIFDVIQRDSPSLVSLPMMSVLLHAVQQAWEHLSSAHTCDGHRNKQILKRIRCIHGHGGLLTMVSERNLCLQRH